MDDPLKRAEVLMRAAHQLLSKQNDSPYVLNLLEQTATYDGCECDGYCLIEDIDDWFEFCAEKRLG